MGEPLKIGSKAPSFKLTGARGKTVSLNDFRGKKNLILVFYCNDNTPG